MNDLRRSREPGLVYPDAFAAQFLSQQVFFHWFPESYAESIKRLRALMQLARQENPGMVLVASALPSYELVGEHPVDPALLKTFGRLPTLTYEGGVKEEQALYYTIRQIAGEEGWLFVDNFTALRQYHGPERLFNSDDYHLLPTGE